jgi:predicted RNase H-like HicB family nuclease
VTRPDREDLHRQREAVDEARVALAAALDALEREAHTAARASRTRRGTPDLPGVYAAARAVERAEEALDLAALDLRTAAGEDA